MFASMMLSGNAAVLKKHAWQSILFPLIACGAICAFAVATMIGPAGRHWGDAARPSASEPSAAFIHLRDPWTHPKRFDQSVTVTFRAPSTERVHARQAIFQRACLRLSRCLSHMATRATGSRSFDLATSDLATSGVPLRNAAHAKRRGTRELHKFVLTRLDADGIAIEAGISVPQVQPASRDSKTDLADDALAIETGLGKVKSVATAGTLNGAPAAALKLSLASGPVLFDARGVTEMTNLSDPGALRKTFKVSTSASIPFY